MRAFAFAVFGALCVMGCDEGPIEQAAEAPFDSVLEDEFDDCLLDCLSEPRAAALRRAADLGLIVRGINVTSLADDVWLASVDVGPGQNRIRNFIVQRYVALEDAAPRKWYVAEPAESSGLGGLVLSRPAEPSSGDEYADPPEPPEEPWREW